MGQFHSLQFNRRACTHTHTHAKSMHMQTQLVCNYDFLYLSFFLHIAQTKDILTSFRNETQVSYSYGFQKWNMHFAPGTTSVHRPHWNNHDSWGQQHHQDLGWPIWTVFSLDVFLYHCSTPFSGYFSVSLAVEHNYVPWSQCHVQKVRYTKYFSLGAGAPCLWAEAREYLLSGT